MAIFRRETGPFTWDEETLYFDGDEYFPALIHAIDSAQRSVSLETYIFEPDHLGERIEAALQRATSRGVITRLLVDGIGSLAWINSRLEKLTKGGVEVRVFHPVRPHLFSRRWSRLNRRTHRKQCLIDESIALVGSLNISAMHLTEFSGREAWRDNAARVKGAPVRDLVSAFEHAWTRSRSSSGRRYWMESLRLISTWRPKSPLVRLNYTARIRRRNFRSLLTKIRTAEKRIYIMNAYLAPSSRIMRALRHAARRGVDVRILVPRKSDVFFMPWVATAYYPRLLKAGVRIFEYLPRFLHAKSLIIDDWSMVGTSNLNQRSLRHDLEVDLVLTNAVTIEKLNRKFEEDLQNSEEIRQARGGLQAWLGRIVIWLFRNWI